MILHEPSPHEIVYLDPAWPRTACGTAKTPYRTMTWEELHAFDLGAWLARDALVFCWLTGPTHLRECGVLSHWCERFGLYEAGIAYVWIKTRQPSAPEMPPGYTLHWEHAAEVSREVPVLVSERRAPEGWSVLDEWTVQQRLTTGQDTGRRAERLYVHESWVERLKL